MLSRLAKAFLLGLSLLFISTSLLISAESPLLGAIRWDAWYDTNEAGNKADTKALSVPKYHRQAPWFAKVVSPNQLFISGDSPEIMSQEIRYARAAGLDYWAFCFNHNGKDKGRHGVVRALELFLENSDRNLMRFCILVHWPWESVGGLESWAKVIDEYVSYAKKPNYLKVAGGRPIFYFFSVQEAQAKNMGGWENTAKAFSQLREACKIAGAGDPYFVAQVTDMKRFDELGFDAVSDYALGWKATLEGFPWEEQTKTDRGRWDGFANAGRQVIPLAMTGWDLRPRSENPPPWEKNGVEPKFVVPPTAEEIAAHAVEALAWVEANAAKAQANTALLYAWNEFAEGGWICPTLGPDGKPDETRVRVLGAAVKKFREGR